MKLNLDPAMDSSLPVAPQKQDVEDVELTGTTAAWVEHVESGALTLRFAEEVFSALKQRR